MKKLIVFILVATAAVLLASCGESASVKTSSKAQGVQDILDNATEKTVETETSADTKSSAGSKTLKKADVDLTELNSNMVYSEVYNMMTESKKYVGKTVRMNGTMDVYKDGDKTYYACIIKDAAACCAQGIEFKLADGSDYPKTGEEVTVYGEFNTYKEDVYTYCELINAELESAIK